jgi:hypothetical protein
MAGEKYDGQSDTGFYELLLKREPTHPRQSYIEDETPWDISSFVAQKVLCRLECFRRNINGTQKRSDCIAHACIIVDNINNASFYFILVQLLCHDNMIAEPEARIATSACLSLLNLGLIR